MDVNARWARTKTKGIPFPCGTGRRGSHQQAGFTAGTVADDDELSANLSHDIGCVVIFHGSRERMEKAESCGYLGSGKGGCEALGVARGKMEKLSCSWRWGRGLKRENRDG